MKLKTIPCEVYSRICGYFRPLKDWNIGKKEEYKDRHQIRPRDLAKGFDKPKQKE